MCKSNSSGSNNNNEGGGNQLRYWKQGISKAVNLTLSSVDTST